MEELFRELDALLSREGELYQELVEMAKSKQDHLVQNDLEGIGEVLTREEEILDRIADEEEKRKNLLEKMEGEDKNFNKICEEAPAELTENLREIRQALLLTMEELWEVNETNNRLIQDSLVFNKNMVQSLAKIRGASTYSREGKKEDHRSFIDKKA